MNDIGELKIVHKNWHIENETAAEMIEYPLYEANYVNAVRNVFHAALNQKVWNEKNQKRIFKNELKNIIAFIGERGSGKTTAMDEFCRILQYMDRDDKKRWWINYTLEKEDSARLQERSFKFYIVSPVDAALLGEKDDLFELILVNIYKEFERDLEIGIKYKDEQFSKVNETVELFQELLEMYHISKESKMEKLHTTFSLMNYMAGSYEIQGKVAQLVDKLLDFKQVRYDFEYIVITIDDLDLNLQHGYQMLELLQKYFSYYKIILITAIDYKQMSFVCEEHFKNEMERSGAEFYGSARSEHYRKLANDYMTKIFPFSQRIYMPDMKKLARNICVLADSKHEGEKEIPVKKYIMLKVAKKMKIFYDACGLKWHFCELETIRELVSYNEFLDMLIPIDYTELVYADFLDKAQGKNNLQLLRKYDRNHEQFNRDIVMRLSQNMLTPHQKDIFTELNKRDLERRANYFVNLQIDDMASEIGHTYLCVSGISENKYAYGDVLEKIYRWGRKYYDVKPLISCIMASFTSEMVREYLNYRYNPRKDSRAASKKRLLGFLGESFGNNWCAAAFPRVLIKVNDETIKAEYGYVRRISQSLISIDISMKCLQELDYLSDENKIKKLIREWIEKEKIVETLECMDLFFIRKTEGGFEGLSYIGEVIDKSIILDTALYGDDENSTNNEASSDEEENFDDEKIDEEEGEYLRITGIGNPVTLDMMAFVLKSLDYEAHKRKIQNNIIGMLAEIIKERIMATDEEERMVEGLIRELVMERSLFTTEVKNGFAYEAAFPFYDLDMSYNIWKRVRRRFANKVYRENKVFAAVKIFLRYIEYLIENEESFYQAGGQSTFEYLKNFTECPYVKALRKQKSDGIVSKRLSKVLRILMINQEEPENAEE